MPHKQLYVKALRHHALICDVQKLPGKARLMCSKAVSRHRHTAGMPMIMTNHRKRRGERRHTNQTPNARRIVNADHSTTGQVKSVEPVSASPGIAATGALLVCVVVGVVEVAGAVLLPGPGTKSAVTTRRVAAL